MQIHVVLLNSDQVVCNSRLKHHTLKTSSANRLACNKETIPFIANDENILQKHEAHKLQIIS